MRKLLGFVFVLTLLFGLASNALALTVLVPTTLSSALTTSTGQAMSVTSATYFAAGTTMAYIDRELVAVTAVSGTRISIQRGQQGTVATPHASGAIVLVGDPTFFVSYTPMGACTRSSEKVLPRVNIKDGVVADCLAGTWVASTANNGTRTAARSKYYSPDPGGTAYTALETNGTAAGAATELYCTEVYLPTNKVLTGLGVLNGTTVGTNYRQVALFDMAGNVIAQQAAAGLLTSGASTYQSHPFTSPYFAVGPASYLGCFIMNGTTDTTRHMATSTQDQIIAGKVTGQTFGVIVNITPPTTFTTVLGGYMTLY